MNPNEHYQNGFKWIATILGSLVLFSIISVQLDLDRKFAGLFFSESEGWYLQNAQPWRFLWQYGTIPGFALSIFALLGYFICQAKKRYRHWRNYLLLIFLTSILGAGLLVNTVLKPYWGRPRPCQTIEFGGLLEYRPMHTPGEPGRGKSFAGGHSTMGFIFVTLFFFYRKSRTVAFFGLVVGLVVGSMLSLARIVQGAHFLSDNVWSLGIILLTSTWLYYFVLCIPTYKQRSHTPLPLKKKLIIGGCLTVAIAGAAFFNYFKQPYYNSYQRKFHVNPRVTGLTVLINENPERQSILYKNIDQGHLIIHSHGVGRSTAKRTIQFQKQIKSSMMIIKTHLTREGFFSELDHDLELWLPKYLEPIASNVDIISTMSDVSKTPTVEKCGDFRKAS